MKFLMMAVMLLAWQGAWAGVYRWVDEAGHVHYGDKPTEDAEQVRVQAAPAAASGVEDASLPYEARLASKNFPVTLYVPEKCGEVCKQAQSLLKKRRVPFSEKLISTQEEYDAFKKESGSDSFPALKVGKNWVKGYEPGQWNSELDVAGYPK